MSANVTLTGNLGSDPQIRYLNDGTAVTNLNIGCTPSRNNNGTWENIGDPLWISVSLWRDDATWAADNLRKGASVAFSGVLKAREFEGRIYLELHYPRFLGVKPKVREASAQPGAGQGWGAPTAPPDSGSVANAQAALGAHVFDDVPPF